MTALYVREIGRLLLAVLGAAGGIALWFWVLGLVGGAL